MSPSRSQRRCLIRIRLDPFPHLPASPYFATFERRRAFNSFECGDVPSLHLAMDLPSIWRWRLSDMSPSRSQRRCLIRIRLDPFPHLPASPYFATFERRRAFNSFECGDVPSLHLAMSAGGYLSVETAKPDRDVGCSARWKASVSAGAGPLLASDPGSLSLPSSAVRHSIHLNAETCLSSIWRCRLADTFPSRPPNPIGMLVVLPAGKLRYRLARVRFWLLILVRFHCHRAPFGIQFI